MALVTVNMSGTGSIPSHDTKAPCPLHRDDQMISSSSVVPKNRPDNNTCREDITMAFGFCSTPLFKFILKQFSTSVESRTEKLLSRTYVRTMPLILANSYRITSILHTVLSTITVNVFIEKSFEPPLPLSPSPFFWVFWGVFLRNFGA